MYKVSGSYTLLSHKIRHEPKVLYIHSFPIPLPSINDNLRAREILSEHFSSQEVYCLLQGQL